MRKIIPIVILLVFMSACGQIATQPTPTELVEASTQAIQETPPAEVQILAGQTSQWAIEAQASSEFANDEWSAAQALGSPNTARCGDYQTAWATAASDSEDWLELRFPLALHVTAINVVQTFNPNQVVKVELIGNDGRALEIYHQPPIQIERPCPYTLSVPVDATIESYDRVRISLDQSILGLGWNQIDAVQMIGEQE